MFTALEQRGSPILGVVCELAWIARARVRRGDVVPASEIDGHEFVKVVHGDLIAVQEDHTLRNHTKSAAEFPAGKDALRPHPSMMA